jgi:hypothetical protein
MLYVGCLLEYYFQMYLKNLESSKMKNLLLEWGSRVFVFLEMGLYRSRIEFLVMFEVVQHSL